MAFSARPDGTTEFVNRPWLDYTGLEERANLSIGWESTVYPGDVDDHARKWHTSLQTGVPFENEERHRNANSQYRWFLARSVPLRDSRGNVLKWYGTLTDIEDRKRAEEESERIQELQAELAHISRVTTMGELTASLAHEIRQPITAAANYALSCRRWLSRAQPDLEQARAAASNIIENLKSTDNIINRVRLLFHKGMPQREEVDVNELIREVIVLLRSAASQDSIAIRTQTADNLPCVMADKVQLQQVLMNLMLNGIEAMKNMGPAELTVTSQAANGEIRFSVSDTGVGLPTEGEDRIFKAFYTTKPDGTGMGLAISRSIIEAHGGQMWATPNPGPGATFHFTLPTKGTAAQ
jgi:PAS domain S-box-containing protein